MLAVYHALATGPQWEKTLLIVFYDEHGGFFDHVAPPEAPDDDPTMFGRYGVRIPALIVSPWIEPLTVSHTLFDHTSIIKTILLRFCPDALKKPKLHHGLLARLKRLGHPRYLGERVAHANDLGELLARTEPRPAPDRYALVQDAAARAAARPEGAAIDQDAPRQPMTDLQIRIAAANRHLRILGTPRAGRSGYYPAPVSWHLGRSGARRRLLARLHLQDASGEWEGDEREERRDPYSLDYPCVAAPRTRRDVALS